MDDRTKIPKGLLRPASREGHQPFPPPALDHSLKIVLTSLEVLFTRLQSSLESQNARLRNIELGMADMAAGKFDALITVGNRLSDNIGRLVQISEKGSSSPRAEKAHPDQTTSSKLTATQIAQRQIVKVYGFSSVPVGNPMIRMQSARRTIAMKESPVKEKESTPKPVERLITAQPVAAIDSKPRFQFIGAEFLTTSESLALFNSQAAKQLLEERASIPPTISEASLVTSIRQLVGQFATITAERIYARYSEGNMLHNQLRAAFSWKVLEFGIQLDRSIRTQCHRAAMLPNQSAWRQINGAIDSSFRGALEYLIKKYPPSKHKIVDTELAKHIKEVKRQGQIQYDILKNAGVSFAFDDGKAQYSKNIKLWINRLIAEIKQKYPIFKSHMKEIFSGREGSELTLDEQVEYEVGAKIGETVQSYSESQLNEPGLSIKSPHIQRVLVKWAEQLRKTLTQPTEVIKQNKSGFKSVSGTYAIQLTTSRKEELSRRVDHITSSKLIPTGMKRRLRLLQTVSGIMALSFAGIDGYSQLPHDQLIQLKAAQYMEECSQTFLSDYLNSMLEHLNLIRKTYSQDLLQSGVDLITCNILDILRCRCIGNKKDIKRIYESLIASPHYEVIRVKNKLNESTRDILINFKPRDSFLICEMQLSLGNSKDQINDHFCHYLYELQRSYFPVLFEASSQIINFDPRSSYILGNSHPIKNSPTKIKKLLQENLRVVDGKAYCSLRHPSKEMQFQPNGTPFCCMHCTSFVGAFDYMIQSLRCNECGVSICPKCTLRASDELQDVYMRKYVDGSKLNAFLPAARNRLVCEFSTEKNLLPKIKEQLQVHQYLIIYLFSREGIKPYVVKQVDQHIITTFFGLDGKILQFSDSKHESWNSILITQKVEQIDIEELQGYSKQLIDDTPWHQLELMLQQRNIKTVIGVRDEQTKQILVMDIPEKKEQIQAKLSHMLILKQLAAESSKAQATVEITSKGLTDLSVLQYIRNPASVRSLNLWGNRLKSISDISAFSSLAELVLRENIVESISQAKLSSLQNIKLLNLQRNSLRGSLTRLPLPNLQILDISVNQLTDIASLGEYEYKDLQICRSSFNKLTAIPTLRTPKLEVFLFNNNQVTSLDAFVKAPLAKLNSLNGTNNQISGVLPLLNLPELKYLQLGENAITSIQIFCSSRLLLLESLVLSKNKIEGALPVIKAPTLRTLRLEGNRIADMENAGEWQLPALELLDLSNNQVTGRLPKLTLRSLKEAKFNNNGLTDADNLSDSRLDCLEKLTLCQNKLVRLPVLSLFQLRELDISKNSLQSFGMLGKCRLPRLRKLDLSKNRISSGLSECDVPQLEQLILDDNDISSMEELIRGRHMLPSLIKVSFKGNSKLAIKQGEGIQFQRYPVSLRFVTDVRACAQKHNFNSDT